LPAGSAAVGSPRTIEDVVVREVWAGTATLELRPNAQRSVHRLVVDEIALGLHGLVDLTFPPGAVVPRYD